MALIPWQHNRELRTVVCARYIYISRALRSSTSKVISRLGAVNSSTEEGASECRVGQCVHMPGGASYVHVRRSTFVYVRT